jgi:hypothetical protein
MQTYKRWLLVDAKSARKQVERGQIARQPTESKHCQPSKAAINMSSMFRLGWPLRIPYEYGSAFCRREVDEITWKLQGPGTCGAELVSDLCNLIGDSRASLWADDSVFRQALVAVKYANDRLFKAIVEEENEERLKGGGGSLSQASATHLRDLMMSIFKVLRALSSPDDLLNVPCITDWNKENDDAASLTQKWIQPMKDTDSAYCPIAEGPVTFRVKVKFESMSLALWVKIATEPDRELTNRQSLWEMIERMLILIDVVHCKLGFRAGSEVLCNDVGQVESRKRDASVMDERATKTARFEVDEETQVL